MAVGLETYVFFFRKSSGLALAFFRKSAFSCSNVLILASAFLTAAMFFPSSTYLKTRTTTKLKIIYRKLNEFGSK